MEKARIKQGDVVMVTAGKDKGRKGKVLRVFPVLERVTVEGMNIRKKHVRPKTAQQKGQIVEFPAPFHISNVQIFCTSCGRAVRVGYTMDGAKKQRVCKKCGKAV